MVDKSAFMKNGKFSLSAVIGVLFGGWALAIGDGIADLIDKIFADIVGLIEGVIDFEAALGSLIASLISGNVGAAWTQAVDASKALGPLSIWIVAAQVVAVLWLLDEGREHYV